MCPVAEAPQEWFGQAFEPSSKDGMPKPTSFTAKSFRKSEHRADPSGPASLRGPAMDQAVLPLCSQRLVERRRNYKVDTGPTRLGRNSDWQHLFNRDVISMPDKWEYPWYAAWDLAFHMLPMADVIGICQATADPVLERMVHASQRCHTSLRVGFQRCESTGPRLGVLERLSSEDRARQRDNDFLARTFQKLLLNFTWWVNRKDPEGKQFSAAAFSAWTTSACLTAVSHSHRWLSRPSRCHGLDGILLRHHAAYGLGTGHENRQLMPTWPASSWNTMYPLPMRSTASHGLACGTRKMDSTTTTCYE